MKAGPEGPAFFVLWPAAPSHIGAGKMGLTSTWRMRGFQTPEQNKPIGIEFQIKMETLQRLDDYGDTAWMTAHWHGPLHL